MTDGITQAGIVHREQAEACVSVRAGRGVLHVLPGARRAAQECCYQRAARTSLRFRQRRIAVVRDERESSMRIQTAPGATGLEVAARQHRRSVVPLLDEPECDRLGEWQDRRARGDFSTTEPARILELLVAQADLR